MTNSATTNQQPIVFILDNVADYASMADGMYANYEVHVLSADGDALAQMASYLDGRSGIEAIHLVSHGQEGQLDLGTVALNSSNLADYGDSLAVIRGALSQDADFLIYGCDAGQGTVGVEFVNALAQATGADVAASDDVTGPAVHGGDAVLEVQSGSIEAATLDAGTFQTNLDASANYQVTVSNPNYAVTEDGASSGWTVDGSSSGLSGTLGLVNSDDPTAVVDSVVFSLVESSLVESPLVESSFTSDSGQITALGSYGSLTLNPVSGDYEYHPSVNAIDALGDGNFADTFNFNAIGVEGNITPGTFTFSVTGANDAPTIVLEAPTATLVEAGGQANGEAGRQTAQIGIQISDAEGTGQIDTFKMTNDDGWTLSANSEQLIKLGVYGTAYLTVASRSLSYELNDQSSATQALTANDAQDDRFVIHVKDGQGASAQSTAVFSIQGADDAPDLHVAEAQMPENYTDGNGQEQRNFNRSGLLSLTDVDTDVLSYGSVTFNIEGGFRDDGSNISSTGNFGMLVLHESGTYNYVANTQAMATVAAGEMAYDVFNLTMSNESGWLGTTTYEVEIIGTYFPASS